SHIARSGLITTASAAAPRASYIRPRWRSGSCDDTRTAFTPVMAAKPSAPCDSAAFALGASDTSTMNEMPSPSAIAWLSLLTRRDRSRRGANRETQATSYSVDALRGGRPRRIPPGHIRCRRARPHRDATLGHARRDATGGHDAWSRRERPIAG